ncbi:MAG: indole-3-glycerol phosphate synthase TrpC [Lutibacter sp.]
MNILEEIIAFKKLEVKKLKEEISVKQLIESPNFKRNTFSLKKELSDKTKSGIIAEYKRKSPSKGIINDHSLIEDVTKGYLEAGVSAQSVLTDLNFFGGSVIDLIKARTINQSVPILRKDFIVDGYQIVESKAIGADVILLIATVLSAKEIKQFTQLANDLGLEVLIEIHTQKDLEKIEFTNQIIGINNRNLKTFDVDLDHSLKLASMIPNSCLKVSESGISNPETIKMLKQKGFNGFLIGENFMKTENPGLACKDFIDKLINKA